MNVKCPTCRTAVEWSEKNESRPFCSERCKLIDLGAWSSESYRIPLAENEQWSEQSLEQLEESPYPIQ